MGDSVLKIEALDVENYSTWSVRMKLLLIHKGLWKVVDTKEGDKVDKDEDMKALALIGLNVKDHHI